jgi:hypothetical protein
MKKQLISILILTLPLITLAQDPADGDAVLPVVWKSFSGKASQSRIVLSWETATERNAKDFVIEHSSNGSQWDSVGIVTASGNSVTVRNYGYTHQSPSNGTNHYRLLQRDLDGKSAFSKTISVKLNNAAGLTVLGNPVEQGVLKIRLNQSARVTLHDASGRMVYSGQQPGGISSVNVSRYAKGWYVLRVEDAIERIWIR